MNELSLFTGAGGGLLGTSLLGFRHVGYVERDAYCQAVLQARIRDGFLDPAPIFGDIREFLEDGWADRYRGLVDVVTGGFPCQPHSVAGKQLGADDPRDMWPETADVLRRVRPPFAFLENVPGLASSGYLGRVLGDLAELGFDAEWTVRSAADVGAPHLRKRLWILAVRRPLADADRRRLESQRIGGLLNGERAAFGHDVDGCGGSMADADRAGLEERCRSEHAESQHSSVECGSEAVGESASGGLAMRRPAEVARNGRHALCTSCQGWWERDPADAGEPESFVGRVAFGVAHRVDQLRALGNGQVPAVVVSAWRELVMRVTDRFQSTEAV